MVHVERRALTLVLLLLAFIVVYFKVFTGVSTVWTSLSEEGLESVAEFIIELRGFLM